MAPVCFIPGGSSVTHVALLEGNLSRDFFFFTLPSYQF